VQRVFVTRCIFLPAISQPRFYLLPCTLQMNIKAYLYSLLGYKTPLDLLIEIEEGTRVYIDKKDLERGEKLAKTTMPKGLVYPLGGETYEALQDVEVSYLIHHIASNKGGGKVLLFKGERVLITKPESDKPTSYYCLPINIDEVEKRFISKPVPKDLTYSGYSLFIDTVVLNNNFKKVG